jgi:hypothetical protein
MKRQLVLLLLIINFSLNIFSQDIPNSSFNNWIMIDDYENPESWETANSITYTNPIYVTTTNKTQDSYSGDFAVELESKQVLTFVVPGFITLGDFDIDIWTQESSITGGIPFNIRPDKIKLYYKYFPAENDFFRIGMWMLKNNGTENPDTVGTALFESYQQKDAYTEIVLNVEYRTNEDPEILNIMAVSSNPDNPVVGSKLIIDDISFICSTGISEIKIISDAIYPNPVDDIIFLNEKYLSFNFEIINTKGQTVFKSQKIKSEKINVAEFPAGIYLIKFINEEKNEKYVQRIIKK